MSDSKTDRFHQLSKLLRTELDAENHDRAQALAQEYLTLAETRTDDWNYGNAIHHAHTALGRIALRQNDVATAKMHLLAAGATPGSPQLRSFGPTFSLAAPLLQRGETEAVLRYLDQVQDFWMWWFSWWRLRRWRRVVRRGEVPKSWTNWPY